MREEHMRRGGPLMVLKVLLIAVFACTVVGFVVMHLWNWLIPSIFGLRVITFWQALGLFALGRLLLGGFARHAGRGRAWGGQMLRERWAQMSPEERERFRSGMRGHRGCGFGRQEEPTPASTTASDAR